MPTTRPIRPLLRVALPVAIASVLVCLAVVNVALFHRFRATELEDGVLWKLRDGEVVADLITEKSAAARAGIQSGDVLLKIDQFDVRTPADVVAIEHDARGPLTFQLLRARTESIVPVVLQPPPSVDRRLYYSLAVVGIFTLIVGASVRLRRPGDLATLHFFWLAVAFFGGLAFTFTGDASRLDYFFYWSDAVAWLVLPGLFLHFALVFPDRPSPWIRSDRGRAMVPLFYVPALLLGGARIALFVRGIRGPQDAALLERLDLLDLTYLSVALVAGLGVMLRALRRLRSVTARRQLRWIVWGSALGALPFIVAYGVPTIIGRPVPGGEYTAVLLTCIPLAFASAIVRYRLTDVEVIIKRGLALSSVGLGLVIIYFSTLQFAEWVFRTNADQNNSIALLATLIVALVAPWLWKTIQVALDRLYYRERYDYRRAIGTFARELNSDLDLDRLSARLVARVRDTLGTDRIALFLADPADPGGDFSVVASVGFEDTPPPKIVRATALGERVVAGQTSVIDDTVFTRRFSGEQAAEWRDAGLECFVPCVSKDVTIAVLAAGRRGRSEPLSSEDLALLGAVAPQAATAIENARLYGALRTQAAEVERLRQFSDSVVESLSDGLLVVDLDDRVLRWNRRLEDLLGLERGKAIGRRLSSIFDKQFLDSLYDARRESPAAAALYRLPLAVPNGARLVNVGIAPFKTPDGVTAGSIIVLEDVTDRANLEEQLRLSEKMAAIGLLAAGVAHEVNTPLTGISSFTQMLLERSPADDPNVQLLEKIERQTFRAAKIVNSLLNLARPSDGEAGPVDLNVILNDVLSLLEHQFRSGRIQVRKELMPSGVFIKGVEYKLQQVFLNLLLNARDAMPRGGWLTLTTRLDGRGAVVEVSDTGGGIPSEHLARIYDPFFTTKSDGRGTGLGLSVTYGIVQEHGGTLSCDSVLGQGTKFTLTLPPIAAAAAAGEALAH
ncbi:MAG: PAS domain S-box protein [Acidobacteria bacterium]|nr:MAG: PAS domain S-box protein [Acidobacteriota bacterium]